MGIQWRKEEDGYRMEFNSPQNADGSFEAGPATTAYLSKTPVGAWMFYSPPLGLSPQFLSEELTEEAAKEDVLDRVESVLKDRAAMYERMLSSFRNDRKESHGIVEWKKIEDAHLSHLSREGLFFEGRMIAAIEKNFRAEGDWYAYSYSYVGLKGIYDPYLAPGKEPLPPLIFQKMKALVEEEVLSFLKDHHPEKAVRFEEGLSTLRRKRTFSSPNTFHDRLAISLEAGLASRGLSDVEITEEDAKKVEKLIKQQHKGVRTAVGIVLDAIKNTLEEDLDREEEPGL